MNKVIFFSFFLFLFTSCNKNFSLYDVVFDEGHISYGSLCEDTDIIINDNLFTFKKGTVITFSLNSGMVKSGFLKKRQSLYINDKVINITPITDGKYVWGKFDISFHENGNPYIIYLSDNTSFVCNGKLIKFSKPITKKRINVEGDAFIEGFRECLFLWNNGNPQCGFTAENLNYNDILIPKGALIRLNKDGDIISYSIDDENDILINE